jgi:hypothetical protein
MFNRLEQIAIRELIAERDGMRARLTSVEAELRDLRQANVPCADVPPPPRERKRGKA